MNLWKKKEMSTQKIQPIKDPNRITYHNGYYERDYTTKIGTLTLRVPRTRDGKFRAQVFERYQRNEKALLATIL